MKIVDKIVNFSLVHSPAQPDDYHRASSARCRPTSTHLTVTQGCTGGEWGRPTFFYGEDASPTSLFY